MNFDESPFWGVETIKAGLPEEWDSHDKAFADLYRAGSVVPSLRSSFVGDDKKNVRRSGSPV